MVDVQNSRRRFNLSLPYHAPSIRMPRKGNAEAGVGPTDPVTGSRIICYSAKAQNDAPRNSFVYIIAADKKNSSLSLSRKAAFRSCAAWSWSLYPANSRRSWICDCLPGSYHLSQLNFCINVARPRLLQRSAHQGGTFVLLLFSLIECDDRCEDRGAH